MLVLLYYLSQNPDFTESVKPLMGQLKNSQQMLNFLNDLSKFNETFSTLKNQGPPPPSDKDAPPRQEQPKKENKERAEEKQSEKEKPSESPTSGIADDFIQRILDSYLKKR